MDYVLKQLCDYANRELKLHFDMTNAYVYDFIKYSEEDFIDVLDKLKRRDFLDWKRNHGSFNISLNPYKIGMRHSGWLLPVTVNIKFTAQQILKSGERAAYQMKNILEYLDSRKSAARTYSILSDADRKRSNCGRRSKLAEYLEENGYEFKRKVHIAYITPLGIEHATADFLVEEGLVIFNDSSRSVAQDTDLENNGYTVLRATEAMCVRYLEDIRPSKVG